MGWNGSTKRWVASPPPGHWEDENGNATSAPEDPKPATSLAGVRAVAGKDEGPGYGFDPDQIGSIPPGGLGHNPGDLNNQVRGPSGQPIDDPFVDKSAKPRYAPAPGSDLPSATVQSGWTATPGMPHGPGQAPRAGASTPGGSSAQDAADRARKLADEALGRHTDPGTITPTTAEAPTIDRTGTIQYAVQPDFAGRTSAPDQVHVDPITGSIIGAQQVGSREVGGPQVSHSGLDLQQSAAAAFQDMLAGRSTLAEQQLKAAQDRAAAEQLSIAAGARGQGVVGARRNAATNIGLQRMEAGGQFAELRAKEIADAAAGLGNLGAQVQGEHLAESGQAIDVNKTNAANTLDASKTNAGNALDASKANQAADLDVKKSNQAVDAQTKLAHAQQQLTADLASDDRLQGMLNKRAELAQAANAGNQQAATQLAALDAQIKSRMAEFNATQIQSATAANIENRLRAMGLDDQFIATMSQQFIAAANANDQLKLDALKTQIMSEAAKNAKSANDFNAWAQGLGLGAKFGVPLLKEGYDFITGLGDGTAEPGGTDSTRYVDENGYPLDASGQPLTMSDRRLKEQITLVKPSDIDGFLRTVGKSAGKEWQYKPGKGLPSGRKIGPMAQDLAADKLASAAVGSERDGTMSLDFQQLAALALAGLGRLNERVEDVETKPRGRTKPDVDGYLRSRARG